MLLHQLADNLRDMRRASVNDLAISLAIEPSALQGMLTLLESKGRVRRVVISAACGSCDKCDPETNEIYEWID